MLKIWSLKIVLACSRALTIGTQADRDLKIYNNATKFIGNKNISGAHNCGCEVYKNFRVFELKLFVYSQAYDNNCLNISLDFEYLESCAVNMLRVDRI